MLAMNDAVYYHRWPEKEGWILTGILQGWTLQENSDRCFVTY